MLQTAESDRLGPNLRALRQERGLTLDRLAGMSELTRGYLSLVERGLKTPSITALLRVARALDVNIAQLFDLNAAPNVRYTLQRAGDHDTTDRSFGLTPLAPGRASKMMEPFLMRPAHSPGAIGGPRWAHGGEEMIFVVSGRVAVKLGGEEILMGRGDCLYFSGEERHEVRSLGEEQAEVLVVIAAAAG
ncbi:transcriptional regulator with XRE-family HTH domain [Methylopila capsulata]|uniref:Transcriptional regulator n=1 Tax=Methylopila capsulata TaxID=61654 RepID=A0A9W6MQZ2_9HYPH|nr:XRE family transcriptional regulator [Methylopila capsulata]MBM7851496.1 transcriptional regulator with XRE-family HTH domain [Methylopila capsulata]GLK54554.1 transcriptional regulator [Methylopila capsulata]